MNFYFDERWIGAHGIGRVAAMLSARIPFRPLGLSGKPSQPHDSLRLALALRKKSDADLFFSPGYNAPAFASVPFVFCIHDLCHIECPEARSFLKSLYFRTVTKRACHNAAFVLTVSDFSRTRILEWSGLPGSHVINVGNGVDPEYCPEGPEYSFPKPYLLCVSNRRPHKNERRILHAFAHAKGLDGVPLLITGSPSPEIQQLVQRLRLSNRVTFLGRIPDADLPALYRSALALVFPSLYEGFGLPLVEAMASGLPVLTSCTTSLPEVSGNATLLVDPHSVDQITHGIERIVSDSALRKDLRERGLQRAKLFSWDSTAQRVLAVLTQVAGGQP